MHLHPVRSLKIAALIAAGVLTLTACGAGSTSPSGGSNSNSSSASVVAALAAKLPAEVRKRGVLRVGVVAPTPPMVMQGTASGDELTGVDIDLATAFANRAGLKLEVHKYQFTGLLAALEADQVDVLWSGLTPNPERLAVANFVIYLSSPFGILVSKGNPDDVDATATGLCGHRVGIPEGTALIGQVVAERQKLCADAGDKKIETVTYSATDALLLAVKTGQVDATVAPGFLTEFLATNTDDGKAYDSILDQSVGFAGQIAFPGGVAVRREDTQLLKALQYGLGLMRDDRSYSEILGKYGLQTLGVVTFSINKLEE